MEAFIQMANGTVYHTRRELPIARTQAPKPAREQTKEERDAEAYAWDRSRLAHFEETGEW